MDCGFEMFEVKERRLMTAVRFVIDLLLAWSVSGRKWLLCNYGATGTVDFLGYATEIISCRCT